LIKTKKFIDPMFAVEIDSWFHEEENRYYPVEI